MLFVCKYDEFISMKSNNVKYELDMRDRAERWNGTVEQRRCRRHARTVPASQRLTVISWPAPPSPPPVHPDLKPVPVPSSRGIIFTRNRTSVSRAVATPINLPATARTLLRSPRLSFLINPSNLSVNICYS